MEFGCFYIGEKICKKGLVEREYGGIMWAVWLLRFRNKIKKVTRRFVLPPILILHQGVASSFEIVLKRERRQEHGSGEEGTGQEGKIPSFIQSAEIVCAVRCSLKRFFHH